jgi:hypothetical protein
MDKYNKKKGIVTYLPNPISFSSSSCGGRACFLCYFFVYQLEMGGLGSILIRNHPS